MGLLDRIGLRSPLDAQIERVAAVPAERRDPTAATRPLSYQSVGHPMVPDWDAETAIRWAYLANVFVFACVRAIATDLASLPFRAGADPGKPADYNPNARLAQLLGPPPLGPAPKLSARRLWAWSIAQRLVTGRFAWELEVAGRTGSEIVAMWPLVSAKLQAIPSESGNEWFSGFRYGRLDKPVRLGPDQVFYAWNPSQSDFRQPESALQAARLDISVAVMQDRYDYAFLKNDARPASLIVTEAFAESSERDRFRDQWNAEFRGPDNAGKPKFVEAQGDGDGGLDSAVVVKTLGLSQKDAAFIERYEAKVRSICVALGVPMSRLMDASQRTFSNSSQEWLNYWQSTLIPLATDLADDVNLDLAPRLGSEVGWFDFSGVEVLKPAPKYQQVGLPSLVGPVMTQNEARAEMGLPRVEGGDSLVDPVALALAATGVAAQPDPAAVAQDIVAAAEELLTATVSDAMDRAVDEAETRAQARHPHSEDSPEVRRAKIWRATDAQAKALERMWERSWRGLFARQEKATLSRLRGKRGRQAIDTETRAVNPDNVFDLAHWTEESESLAARLYEAVVAVGGPKLAERFGLTFDLEAPYVERFIRERAHDLAGHVTSTTYDAIRSQLAEGVAAGESIESLAARVRHVFEVAGDARSTLIARTEVISAYNGSANLVANELGPDVVGGKEWIATRDDRVRPEHAEADGQVVPVDASFTVGGADYDYPGDPNCRCTVAFLTPEEMAGRARPGGEVRMVALDHVNRLAVRVALGQVEVREATRELAA